MPDLYFRGDPNLRCGNCLDGGAMYVEVGPDIGTQPARDGSGSGCPLVGVAILGRTPAEWLKQPQGEQGAYARNRFHCVEFRDVDSPPGEGREPDPVPDPPGQAVLLDRDEFSGVRMLSAPGRVLV